jgi:hypothetical protein
LQVSPLQAALDRLDLPQRTFATIANVHPTTVSRWCASAADDAPSWSLRVPTWPLLLCRAWEAAPEQLAEELRCLTGK